jgi:hypothetical protein
MIELIEVCAAVFYDTINKTEVVHRFVVYEDIIAQKDPQ